MEDTEGIVTPEIQAMSSDELKARARLIDSEVRILKSEAQRLNHEINAAKERMKDNTDKIKVNRQLPHLVSNIAEILDNPEGLADDFGNLEDKRPSKSVVIKTTSRQTVFLPIPGLVPVAELQPNDLVGVNKDSYLILDKLPAEYDSRVKAMEVDERPTDQYSDIGGADKQIQELIEAVVLPLTHKERFENIGITPPKGVLLYGPPGTGKTMMARAACAATNATFLKLAGSQLVQMFIGDGARMVRDAFALAKAKAPAIIFIDEIDSVGLKRSAGGELSGVREVQRTMLELLNQLDGFSSDDRVKVIAATNRPDMLDPALLRSGRLDRKIELPHPNEEARARIIQIHSRKMNVRTEEVNFQELAKATNDFNGAQLKAVCVEAGMEALRRNATELTHEDFMQGILVVQDKKKKALEYYA
jgi:26S proteasome regulatory subunit T5